MNLLNYCMIFAVTFPFLPCIKGENILFLTPMGSKSHNIYFMSITEALAKRGHHVTMVSPYKPVKKVENVRDVIIANYSFDMYLDKAFEGSSTFFPFITESTKFCLHGLGQQEVQDLKKEKFDIVILSAFFDYCYLSFVHHFKVPFIYAYSGTIFGPYHSIIGNIDFPSVSGNIYLDPGFPLSFIQRLGTTLINISFHILFNLILKNRMHYECIKSGLCPEDMPEFSEINKNASLMIINSVKTIEWPPKPGMPNVIYAGGAHIKAAGKLTKDLEDWVEGSGEDGFIFFSLGSALNPDFFPEKYRQILVKVFGSLKQRVLWKWNKETMPDLPKNVKLQKWLPQSDLLGHPKIKMFITHGGQLSTLESSYHGVPVLGIPIFSEQHYNMKIVQSEGWGRVMELENLEENSFKNLVQEMLTNKKITEIAKTKSVIMKDRLIPPDEEAAYWVEYVLRHKGAPHLRSPAFSLNWYELYNVDVWTLILFVLIGILYVCWLGIKFVFRKCFGFGKYKKEKRKND